MVGFTGKSLFGAAGLLASLLSGAAAVPLAKRAAFTAAGLAPSGDVQFTLGNVTYLANVQYPKLTLSVGYNTPSSSEVLTPITVIVVNETAVTGSVLEAIVAGYTAGDDVFSADFLESVYVVYNGTGAATIDASGLSYLASLTPSLLLLDTAFAPSVSPSSTNVSITFVPTQDAAGLPAGPYVATVSASSIRLNVVYRLYVDSYRDFLYGMYDANDGAGTFVSAGQFYTRNWWPYIPVPSRIYAWSDPRPLAGARVAVKDLFDVKGFSTSFGSQAYAIINPVANVTAPAIQRIVNQGGVLVGKYKLAQFASGADPWNWQDEHYPWNPRGDGYLTCSASSSGGGCSVAAYDWLDFAIGSDTGSSMRRPGAVSGTYANRPSQGMMDLTGALPLGAATDTTGVFSRDVKKWVHFAKNWYSADMHQDPSITGLTPLVVEDTNLFPKRVLYLTDYLPLANPAAEVILQAFLANMTSIFNMTKEEVAFQDLLRPATPNITVAAATTGPIDSITQYQVVGKPLVDAWAAQYDGRYPPVDSGHRNWANATVVAKYTQENYDKALATKRQAVDWFEANVLYSTNESCSESIMVWDIGTGGLPSFREEDLVTDNPAAAFLARTPDRAVVSGASICPIFGCVDMTIPIGQVTYQSNVTYHTEYMPVTVSVIAKRGCDYMLYNMWEKLADEGVLKTIKTGRTAF
ncbi:Amidase signature domain protein [Niveomyces insectorum RCEF 264]|uniref:Amidase signature domain protein n=1 Tax=Niveomyces insectorum RCEF 264 TaxID=1081102 RepID=A0A167W8J7_9HYPO|nr:Amidase signature domain protein [Niveomyces insectorum RCEF 264]